MSETLKHSSQLERLALLLEEMGEAQQVIGKILRHGMHSEDPTGSVPGTNKQQLTKELADVRAAMSLMFQCGDVSVAAVREAKRAKLAKLGRWTHHLSNRKAILELIKEHEVANG